MTKQLARSAVREWFESICVAVILALFVRTFILQTFKIPSGSMENTLLIGDHLIVNKFVFAPSPSIVGPLLPVDRVRRGDVLVFKSPEEPERDLIKRTIGLPGDTIQLKSRKVYVNGAPLDEPYVHDEDPGIPESDVRRNYGPVTVPAGHYFMMGDNRDNSRDSRYWGFMPLGNVKGKALFLYFSLDEDERGAVGGIRWSRLLRQIH